jgi:diaminopimelate epimerase
MRFEKYEGLGNDFLVVDLRDGDTTPSTQDPGIVKALCDRHFGVGGDGVLAVLPPTSDSADARMRVLNADGSEAEMCGNGLRCVVKHLAQHDPSLSKNALTIDTGAGPLTCEVTRDGDEVTAVTVDMGRPRLTREEIPMSGPGDERCIEAPYDARGRELLLTGVSMGNPHAITFVEESRDQLRPLAERLGPGIETSDWFPQKTNVEFARVNSPTDIDLVVWERGVGITLACGTGACATAVAACLTGRAEVDTEITIHLLGGDLAITVAPDYRTVFMRGPAKHVFTGDADLAAL